MSKVAWQFCRWIFYLISHIECIISYESRSRNNIGIFMVSTEFCGSSTNIMQDLVDPKLWRTGTYVGASIHFNASARMLHIDSKKNQTSRLYPPRCDWAVYLPRKNQIINHDLTAVHFGTGATLAWSSSILQSPPPHCSQLYYYFIWYAKRRERSDVPSLTPQRCRPNARPHATAQY